MLDKDFGLGLVADEDLAATTSYPELAEGFAARLDGLSDAEKLSFGKAIKTVGRVGQRALPGVVQGATSGGAVAGPWGAVIGGLAGGAATATANTGRKNVQQRGKVAPPHQPAAPANRSAAQLLALLQRPELMRALASLVVRDYGTQAIQVGTTRATPSAFLNLLGVLSQRAAAESDLGVVEDAGPYLPDLGAALEDEILDEGVADQLMVSLLEAERMELDDSGTAEEWLAVAGGATDEVGDGSWLL